MPKSYGIQNALKDEEENKKRDQQEKEVKVVSEQEPFFNISRNKETGEIISNNIPVDDTKWDQNFAIVTSKAMQEQNERLSKMKSQTTSNNSQFGDMTDEELADYIKGNKATAALSAALKGTEQGFKNIGDTALYLMSMIRGKDYIGNAKKIASINENTNAKEKVVNSLFPTNTADSINRFENKLSNFDNYSYNNAVVEKNTREKQSMVDELNSDDNFKQFYEREKSKVDNDSNVSEYDQIALRYLSTLADDEKYNKYSSFLSKEINKDMTDKVVNSAEKFAGDSRTSVQVAAHGTTIATNMLSGLGLVDNVINILAERGIDQNSFLNLAANYTNAVRNTIADDLKQKYPTEVFGRNVAEFIYQTSSSVIDNVSQLVLGAAITGGFSEFMADPGLNSLSNIFGKAQPVVLAIMSTGAAASTTIELKNKGMSDEKVAAIAIVAGLAEFISEEASLDQIISGSMGRRTLIDYMKYVMKSSFVEGTEEVFSDLINEVADIIINGDKSEIKLAIENYMADGYSEQAAFGMAIKDQFVESGFSFAGGFLSGIMMGAGGVATDRVVVSVANNNSYIGSQAKQSVKADGKTWNIDNTYALLDEAKAKGGEAYELAKSIETRIRDDGTLSNSDIGKLAKALNNNTLANESKATSGVVTKETTDNSSKKESAAQTKFEPLSNETVVLNKYADALGLGEQGKNNIVDFKTTDNDSDLYSYAKEYAAYYNAGFGERSIEEVDKQYQSNKVLTPIQSQAAYSAGQIDLYKETQNEKGSTIRGRSGSERNVGTNSGRSLRILEGDTGEVKEGSDVYARRTSKDKGTNIGRFEKTSTGEELQIGDSRLRVGIYSENQYTKTMNEANALANKYGYKLTMFGGNNISTQQGTANGACRGNNLYARADHPKFTSLQITGHELGHALIRDGKVTMYDIEQEIINSGVDLETAVDMYVDAFTNNGVEMTRDEIKEELFCDSLGNKSIFEEETYEYSQTAKVQKKIREATQGLIEQDQVIDLLERQQDNPQIKNSMDIDGERIHMGSFFSGVGMLEAGLQYEMLVHDFANELNPRIADAYINNWGMHMVQGDVRYFNAKNHKNIFYVHASPVCCSYSSVNYKGGENELDILTADATAKHLRTIKPDVFTLENVKQYRGSKALKLITDTLDKLGYKWDADVYNSADYGAATSRERLILRAVRKGTLPPVPQKQERTTTWWDVTKDYVDTLEETTISPSLMERIKNTSGLDINNITVPTLIVGTTPGRTVTWATWDKQCPTLTTKCGGSRLLMPDGRILRPTPQFLGLIQGLKEDFYYRNKTTGYKVIGNGIPTQLTHAIIGSLLEDRYGKETKGKTLYSTELDTEYLELAKDPENNEARLREMVREAARSYGYDSPLLYHGTTNFGFTKFNNTNYIFTTSNKEFAQQYAGYNSKHNIDMESYNKVDWKESKQYFKNIFEDYANSFKQIKKIVNDDIYEYSSWDIDELNNSIGEFISMLHGNELSIEHYKKIKNSFDNATNGGYDSDIVIFNDLYSSIRAYVEITKSGIAYTDGDIYLSERQASGDYEDGSGIYSLFGKLGNNKSIDAKGNPYNNIIDGKGIIDLSNEYLSNGYDSITIKNVKDSGPYSLEFASKNRNITILKDSSQVKSADLVTYDDNGNIIPLSERFNNKNDDIRYSNEIDSEGNKLSKEQQEYFSNSVVRENGKLIPVYHGSDNDFNSFDIDRYGEANGHPEKAIFFTNDERVSKQFSSKGKSKEFYLNITNPLDLNNLSKKQINEIASMKNIGLPKSDIVKSINEYIKSGNYYAIKHYIDYSKVSELGYDGVISRWWSNDNIENGSDPNLTEYAVFESNQAKLTTNSNPTSIEDIRYSNEIDSDGDVLSKGQQEFFKDSKARDENGNLLVVYHGTPYGGFTKFKGNAIWLTSVYDSAKTYGGAKEGVLFDTTKDSNNHTNKYSVGNKFVFETNDDSIDFVFDSKKEFDEFKKGIGGRLSDYISEEEYNEAYDELSFDEDTPKTEYDILEERNKFSKEVRKKYKEYDKSKLYKTTIIELLKNPNSYSRQDFIRAWYAIDENAGIDEDGISSKEELIDSLKEYYYNSNEENKPIEEFFSIPTWARVPENTATENNNYYDEHTVYKMYANIKNPYIYDNNGMRHNDIGSGYYKAIEYAYSHRDLYDGIIITNTEVGKNGSGIGSTVVAFNSNQIKSTSNKNPTLDDDIRYSIDLSLLNEHQKSELDDAVTLLNVNSEETPYAELISKGEKVEETRYGYVKADNGEYLKVGDRVGIVETGRTKDRGLLKAYATIKEIHTYENAKDFKEAESRHLVNGGKYGFKEGQIKVVYEFENITKLKEPIPTKNERPIGTRKASIINEKISKVGVQIEDDGSVSPSYSLETWNKSDYSTELEESAKIISDAIGVTVEKAKSYINDVNSVAAYIARNYNRIGYQAGKGLSPFISNVEYGGDIDFNTMCPKRRLFIGTFTAIQQALPNTALTAAEMIEIRDMMDKQGLEVQCAKCYVEGSRAQMGIFTKEFLKLYEKYNPNSYVPDMATMNTPDGIEWVRNYHPEVYEQYEYFWNHYGTLKQGDPNLFASQQKPKLFQARSEYDGQLIKVFKNDKDAIKEKNLNGGIRLQSFSDFEIVHMIDAMQVVVDMARLGLHSQAYTKVPAFVIAFGETGIKINMSIDAWDVKDGKLVFNDKEGMNSETAFQLRERFSENVGTILCVYNDEQLLAALNDDRIDFIIPFHRSQWKKSQYVALGLPVNTKDYTYQQNEKWIDPSKHVHEYRGKLVKDKCKNYMPNTYWDFSISGKENAIKYLEMCARDGKRPKFYKFLKNNGDGSYSLQDDGSTDGYWKLLIDFKMYNNQGIGSPQQKVKPIFNINEVLSLMEKYEGGANTYPVANGIVEQFLNKYNTKHSSEIDTTFQEKSVPKQSKQLSRLYSSYKNAVKVSGVEITNKSITNIMRNLYKDYPVKVEKNETRIKLKELSKVVVEGKLSFNNLKEQAYDLARDLVYQSMLIDTQGLSDAELSSVIKDSYDQKTYKLIDMCANDILLDILEETIKQNDINVKVVESQITQAQQTAKETSREVKKSVSKELKEKNLKVIQDMKLDKAQALKDARESKQKAINELKEHYAEVRKNAQLRKYESTARKRLLGIVQRLQNKKVTRANRALLDELIGEIDSVSMSLTEKSVHNLLELKQWYEDQAENDPEFVRDENIEKAIGRLSKFHIKDFSIEDVIDLTNVLLGIEKDINTRNKMIGINESRTIYQLGQAVISDIDRTDGFKTPFERTLVMGVLRPDTFFKTITGYNLNDPLYQAFENLNEGQRKSIEYQMRASKLFEQFANDKEFTDSITGRNAEDVLFYQGMYEYRITPSMRISLYLHSLNNQNLKHIVRGGVVLPYDISLYKKGKKKEAFEHTRTVKLTPTEISEIISGMTDKELAFANAIRRYYTTFSQPLINATSEQLKGYSLATVENYFPINVDKNFLKTDFAEIKVDGTIEGMGSLKERVDSVKPVYLLDVIDVLEKSIYDASRYVGMAIPIRNINKLVTSNKVETENTNEPELKKNTSFSVMQKIVEKFGTEGLNYISGLLGDIQSRSSNPNDVFGDIFSKLKSKYSGAVLSLNPGVAIKQASSLPSAAAILGWDAIGYALKNNPNNVDEHFVGWYSPLLWYRSQGYSTQELGDIKKNDSIIVKTLNRKTLNWIQGMDVLTVKCLWSASIYYVRKNTTFKDGSNEFYSEVGRVFNKVVEETQPNYTVLQRPAILRTNNKVVQALNMFKTQPYQNFNVLYDAIMTYKAESRNAAITGNKEGLAKAKKYLANAITSNLASSIIFSAMSVIWKFVRGKYRDDDDAWLQVLKDLGFGMLANGFGMFPYGSQVLVSIENSVDYFLKNIGEDKFFDAYGNDLSVAYVETLFNSVQGIFDTFGDFAGLSTGKKDWKDIHDSLLEEAKNIAQLYGIPLSNLSNMIEALYVWIKAVVEK